MGSFKSLQFRPAPWKLASTLVVVRAAEVALLSLVAVPGIEAAGEDCHAPVATQSALVSSPEETSAIVIGFRGGFVHRGDPRHPEVQLVQELRQEYPMGTYSGLFENGNIDEACKTIVRQLNAGDGHPVSENSARHARILLFGHSWGAAAVVCMARRLNRAGVPVAVTVQVHSVAKPFSDDQVIPANVSAAANFYQPHGLIHGLSKITAADATRTTIIGNFRRDYRVEPAACRNFPWFSRTFTKGHIEIECDPSLWSEVKALLERYLPNEAVTPRELYATEPPTPGSITEFGEAHHREYLQPRPIERGRTDGHCYD